MKFSFSNKTKKLNSNLPDSSRSLFYLFRNNSGATTIEYAILISLISVVLIVTLIGLGEGIQDTYDGTGNALALVENGGVVA